MPWRSAASAISATSVSACPQMLAAHASRMAGLVFRSAGVVDFLHHGADQARELRNRSGNQRPAKGQIAEEPVERVLMVVIGGRLEQGTRGSGPVVGSGNGQIVLRPEMMKEGAFRHAGRPAQVIDAGGRIAFGANDAECRLQQSGAGTGLFRGFGSI